ncbi:MAG: PrsW family intramembrane metalloprotease [Anaerolineae bacterium]|nr:PrsW family intramembrane metalloprotease [Anaerolineae bacterium]
MTTYGPRFITPPTDDQELYPYRPVWRALAIEVAILTAIAIILYVVIDLLKLSPPIRLQPYLAFGLIAAPCLLWLFFSLLAEYRVSQPRQHLMAVVILSMLVASAVGSPLLDQYFRVDTWLPLAPAVNRILGYTLTAGIVQSIIKYIILHYTIWPRHLRARLDGVAYGIATGIGYATILSLQFVSANTTAPPDIVAFHIFANYALHVATGIVIGYGISEVRFSNPTPIFLTIILVIASIITGITIPIHAGLVNSSLSITSISAPKPLFGLGFSIALLIIISVVIAGLIGNADRLERESRANSEE